MACLSFRDFDLNQTCITGKRNPVVTLDAIRQRYKIDKATQKPTDELDIYVADIVARNRIQSVKLPLEAVDDETYRQIKEALEANKVVKINFGTPTSTLRGRCYALINRSSGQLLQGVSCNATQMNLVSIEEPEAEDFDDIDLDIIN